MDYLWATELIEHISPPRLSETRNVPVIDDTYVLEPHLTLYNPSPQLSENDEDDNIKRPNCITAAYPSHLDPQYQQSLSLVQMVLPLQPFLRSALTFLRFTHQCPSSTLAIGLAIPRLTPIIGRARGSPTAGLIIRRHHGHGNLQPRL